MTEPIYDGDALDELEDKIERLRNNVRPGARVEVSQGTYDVEIEFIQDSDLPEDLENAGIERVARWSAVDEPVRGVIGDMGAEPVFEIKRRDDGVSTELARIAVIDA